MSRTRSNAWTTHSCTSGQLRVTTIIHGNTSNYAQKNSVTLNEPKFQFCQKTVTFACLTLPPSGVQPSKGILSAIRNFPIPRDLTSARSWFGLVNQIAWAYSNGSVMQPFRDLVKQNSVFSWDETLEKAFEDSKNVLIKQSEEGICTFDTKRKTCLQTLVKRRHRVPITLTVL